MIDLPQFRAFVNPARYLIPRVGYVILLTLLLYCGVIVNYFLIAKTIPSAIHWTIIIVLILIVALESILSYVKYEQYSYTFFNSKIDCVAKKKSSIDVKSITSYAFTQKILDKWMNTGTIVLTLSSGKKVYLRNLQNPNQVYAIVQKYNRS